MVELLESIKYTENELKHFRESHVISIKGFGKAEVSKMDDEIRIGNDMVLKPSERLIKVRDAERIDDAMNLAEMIEKKTEENYKVIFGYY